MLKTDNENFFSFSSIGEFRTESVWSHPHTKTETYELIFMLEGTAFIEENGEKFILNKNDMLILEPGIYHGGFDESTGKTAFYWFHYKSDMPLPFKFLSGVETYDIKHLLKQLLHHAHTLPVDTVTVDAAALLIYSELVRCNTENCGETALLHEIYEYTRINALAVTVKDVAEHFGYNPDYISRIFKKRFKTGLKEFIAICRINIARDLLLSTNLSVKQIAARLNYENENAFIKFFMYHEKISPRAFRDRFYNTSINNS